MPAVLEGLALQQSGMLVTRPFELRAVLEVRRKHPELEALFLALNKCGLSLPRRQSGVARVGPIRHPLWLRRG
jgi:hypothetical protein